MSHVTALQANNITSLQVIKNLCKTKNWKFKENQTQYKWFGRHVGDYPIPEGFKQEDLGKCSHAIEIPSSDYEVGVVERDGKYTFLYDFWDRKLKEALGGEEAPELAQGCATEQAILQARALGFTVKARAFDTKTQSVKLQLVRA